MSLILEKKSEKIETNSQTREQRVSAAIDTLIHRNNEHINIPGTPELAILMKKKKKKKRKNFLLPKKKKKKKKKRNQIERDSDTRESRVCCMAPISPIA
jgi:hypothetical protein